MNEAHAFFLLESMVTTTQIKRYAWVVELLVDNASGLTINEFEIEWAKSSLSNFGKEKLERRGWYRCFYDIGMIYGILIEVEKHGENSLWTIINPEVLKGKDIQQWMLACVAHRNLLEECLGMYNRIDIEGFPSENGMLEPVTRAMKNNCKMEVIYKRYGHNPKRHIVEPYFIKTYNHRFYVLCKFDTGNFFTLSFDRILEVKVLKGHFNFPNNLFAEDFFVNSFGVMIPPGDVKPLDIILRAKSDERFYLKDIPLHGSQQIVREELEYVDFSYHIIPTEDFIGAVMQQGDRLEVIAPEEFRNKVKTRLEKAYYQYLAS